MKKQGWLLTCFLVLVTLLLPGCFSSLWTGANLIYDRHNVYKKLNDLELSAKAQQALYQDSTLKCRGCTIDVAVFHGDLLLAGHVLSRTLREEAQRRVMTLTGYRRLFNQLSVGPQTTNALLDSWITTKIRSRIFADSHIDPNDFKVVTCDQIVYLMGDVIPAQAQLVIQLARETAGVRRVVKLFKYYNLSDQMRSR